MCDRLKVYVLINLLTYCNVKPSNFATLVCCHHAGSYTEAATQIEQGEESLSKISHLNNTTTVIQHCYVV